MTDNRQRRNTPTGNRNLKKVLEAIRDFVLRNSKIVFPIILIACVAATVVIALNAGKKKDEAAQEASNETVADANTAEATLGVPVTEEELKNNAYPEVNALIMDYYNAVAAGDVDTVLTISNNVDETEKIRIREQSKYIDSYPSVEIYTKPGPVAGSYLAYVSFQVVFIGYENPVPGVQTFYLCTAEDGTLYMNEGNVEEYVIDYIKQVNMQEDVVELFNKVAVEYNELLVNDPSLSVFLQELNSQMDISVGVALAAAEASAEETEEVTTEHPAEESPEVSGEGSESPEESSGPIKARTTTTINVRSSDSEAADKLGKLAGGKEIEVLEMRPNGWSKIKYEGKDAYVKSDYLEVVTVEDASKLETTGTITAKNTVNVRAKDSETAEKLGVIYEGDTLDLIEKQENGWSKVKYKGQVAYVKSEYVD